LIAVISHSQELPAKQSFGVFASYAPDSSHILIGSAEKRRVWTAGFEYGRTLASTQNFRFDYEGSIAPFFQEIDPTLIGGTSSFNGYTSTFPIPAQRVAYVNNDPLGYVGGGGAPVPIYPIYGSEKSYAVAISPLGGRVNALNRSAIQPTFSVDLGMVISARNLPIDNSASFNYLFSFGPGIELFYRTNASVRIEYLYRHMSNANSGNLNPGVDAGVFRVTLSRRHR
jgi:hypothetical protein